MQQLSNLPRGRNITMHHFMDITPVRPNAKKVFRKLGYPFKFIFSSGDPRQHFKKFKRDIKNPLDRL